MRVDRLDSCPSCRYSLRGLSAAHRCPECGFVYDENTAVWRPAKPWKGFVFSVGLTGYFALRSLIEILIALANGRSPEPWQVAGFCVSSLVCWYVGFRLYRSNRKGRCVAIASEGVFVRTHEHEILVPWSETIEAVKKNRWIKEDLNEYIVTLRTGSIHGDIELDRIFFSDDERESFIAAIEARVRKSHSVDDREAGVRTE